MLEMKRDSDNDMIFGQILDMPQLIYVWYGFWLVMLIVKFAWVSCRWFSSRSDSWGKKFVEVELKLSVVVVTIVMTVVTIVMTVMSTSTCLASKEWGGGAGACWPRAWRRQCQHLLTSILLSASCCQHCVTTISIISRCHHNVNDRHDYILALMLWPQFPVETIFETLDKTRHGWSASWRLLITMTILAILLLITMITRWKHLGEFLHSSCEIVRLDAWEYNFCEWIHVKLVQGLIMKFKLWLWDKFPSRPEASSSPYRHL